MSYINFNVVALIEMVFLIGAVVYIFIDPQVAQALAVLFVGQAIHCQKH